MSVLVFAEATQGQFKKAAFEALTYGRQTAELLGTACHALVLGPADNLAQLGRYGAQKVWHVTHDHLASFDSQSWAAAIAQAAEKTGASVVIMSHTSTGKSIAGRVAIRLGAGSVSGASQVPSLEGNELHVVKPVFSGKAYATFAIKTEKKVISVMGNAVRPEEVGGEAPVEQLSIEVPAPRVQVVEVQRVEGQVPLPEAEIVVSGGRGLKGPENWGMIEELAKVLGAATACSRPVADAGWRPHHEHVGQTGIAIRPNLYIAIGISGAIQHLAGVNNSKVIVVINKDPEAPFFKAADYGVVGDAFEVVPRLIEAIKRFKAQQN